MIKILNIVGARPNFMKIAPIIREMKRRGDVFEAKLVHTGQHYDESMSGSFFEDLGIPAPDHYLEVGSASHAIQTARIMIEFEKVALAEEPDWVLVVGDVNSTIACALVCAKLGIRIAHVEAGLRSFDRTMPEEINRILTDSISDLLLTTSEDADANLRQEGIAQKKVRLVGNVMIDSLMFNLERAKKSDVLARLALEEREFAVLTLHRPSNVDEPGVLKGLLDALLEISERMPIVFPVHPRTKANIETFGLSGFASDSFRFIEPLGYLDFLGLYSASALVLTDSGGLQEETTALGIPCITLRENTERPVTVEMGTNVIAGTDPAKIRAIAFSALDDLSKFSGKIPPLWDGRAAERICDALVEASGG